MNLNIIMNSLTEKQTWNLEQFKSALTQDDKKNLINFFNSKILDKLEKQINIKTSNNLNKILQYNTPTMCCELVNLLKSGKTELLKQLFNLDTTEEFNCLKNLLDMEILDRLADILSLGNPKDLKEIRELFNLKDNKPLNKFYNILKSHFFLDLKKMFLLGNSNVLDEQDIKENSKIKFFIKREDECYYYFAYYYEERANGYIELCQNNDTPKFKKIAKVGDIIINYFNIDFYDIFENYFTSNLENKMKELQNKVGILTSNLLVKYFEEISFNIVSNPFFYYTYGNILINKVDFNQNLEKDFSYLLTAFTKSDSDYININSKACIQFISDIRDIFKLGYTNFKSNIITNILNLTSNNSSSKILYEILPNNETGDTLEVFTINDIFTFLLFDIVQVNAYNIQIKICQNCGKFFIHSSRSDEIYCNYPFNEKGISCRNLSYDEKIKSDEVSKLCRNAYKSQNAKKQYYIKKYFINEEKAKNTFDNWYTQIINKKIDYENGKISFEELKEYIEKTSKELIFL